MSKWYRQDQDNKFKYTLIDEDQRDEHCKKLTEFQDLVSRVDYQKRELNYFSYLMEVNGNIDEKTLEPLLEALDKIKTKDITEEKKLKLFAHVLIQEYRKEIRSFCGEHSHYAMTLKRFAESFLFITLPETIKSGEQLSLASLQLAQRKYRSKMFDGEWLPRYIKPEFAAMIGEDYENYMKSSDKNKDFILELEAYRTHRVKDADSNFMLLFVDIFNFFAKHTQYYKYFDNFLCNAKQAAVHELIKYRREENDGLSFFSPSKESKATMQDGKLGEIVKRYEVFNNNI